MGICIPIVYLLYEFITFCALCQMEKVVTWSSLVFFTEFKCCIINVAI